MDWSEIERLGREKYSLSEEWHLCAADASDSEVIQIRFNKKGPRGGWLRGKQNEFSRFIVRNTR